SCHLFVHHASYHVSITSHLSPLSLHDALPIYLYLGVRKNPVTRLSRPVELLPVRNPDTWFYVIFSEIGYRVTFDLMPGRVPPRRSEEHTSELQSRVDLVCRLLLEKKKDTVNK